MRRVKLSTKLAVRLYRILVERDETIDAEGLARELKVSRTRLDNAMSELVERNLISVEVEE